MDPHRMLYMFARLIRNTDKLEALTFGLAGMELLSELRKQDPEKYKELVQSPDGTFAEEFRRLIHVGFRTKEHVVTQFGLSIERHTPQGDIYVIDREVPPKKSGDKPTRKVVGRLTTTDPEVASRVAGALGSNTPLFDKTADKQPAEEMEQLPSHPSPTKVSGTKTGRVRRTGTPTKE